MKQAPDVFGGPRMRTIVIFAFPLLLLYFCTEPFTAPVAETEGLLVVDGMILNLPGPDTIRLSRSGPVGQAADQPETGARVTIKSESGLLVNCEEVAPGVYISPPDFEGDAGARYALEIVLNNGENYRSKKVLFEHPTVIDSLYYEKQKKLNDKGDTLDGIRLLVDSYGAEGVTGYYRYEWVETYEVKPRYPSHYEYVAGHDPPFVLRDTVPKLCYKSNASSRILVAATGFLSENFVKAFELEYVGTEGYRIKDFYSLLVRQYAMDEESYRYWSQLAKFSENLGTVFDPQPYELRGNVFNINRPEEVVLGIFQASAVTERRIFIDGNDLLDLERPRDPCMNMLTSPTAGQPFDLLLAWDYMIVDVQGALWAPRECADCRVHGSTIKPDFWPR